VKTAVVTAVRGRTSHLSNQLEALRRSDVRADMHVVVAIDDEDAARTVRSRGEGITLVPFCSGTPRIPMAAARNQGAQTAIEGGAELLIFLDVDCIPASNMVRRYVQAAEDPAHRGALLCGPVTYLPPPGLDGYDLHDLRDLRELADPHPARPLPPDDEILPGTDYDLFWSLSFAVTTPTWAQVGGFCTEYTGYGGEDTDFGQRAAEASVPLRWVGGAHAFHQFHPVSDPPIEHLQDIVLNAGVFHARWGWWPMRGWLDAFEERGLITRDRNGRPVVLDA
jgi:N-acetylglucosaminyl-diphospho-decaprenol L-rhamnosyltransferase